MGVLNRAFRATAGFAPTRQCPMSMSCSFIQISPSDWLQVGRKTIISFRIWQFRLSQLVIYSTTFATRRTLSRTLRAICWLDSYYSSHTLPASSCSRCSKKSISKTTTMHVTYLRWNIKANEGLEDCTPTPCFYLRDLLWSDEILGRARCEYHLRRRGPDARLRVKRLSVRIRL